MQSLKKGNEVLRAGCGLAAGFAAGIAYSINLAFAAPGNSDELMLTIARVLNGVRSVGGALAAVVLGTCLLMILITSTMNNSQATKNWKNGAIVAIVSFLFLTIMPSLIMWGLDIGETISSSLTGSAFTEAFNGL